MRRGGIPYDQLQKTNMYADESPNKAAQNNGDGYDHNLASTTKKKKKKKGGKRQQQIQQPAPEMEDFSEDNNGMDESQISSHEENRKFFE